MADPAPISGKQRLANDAAAFFNKVEQLGKDKLSEVGIRKMVLYVYVEAKISSDKKLDEISDKLDKLNDDLDKYRKMKTAIMNVTADDDGKITMETDKGSGYTATEFVLTLNASGIKPTTVKNDDGNVIKHKYTFDKQAATTAVDNKIKSLENDVRKQDIEAQKIRTQDQLMQEVLSSIPSSQARTLRDISSKFA